MWFLWIGAAGKMAVTLAFSKASARKRADKVKPGSRQRRHVQRLADVAGGIGPIRMFVEERAARRKIEQRGASQQQVNGFLDPAIFLA